MTVCIAVPEADSSNLSVSKNSQLKVRIVVMKLVDTVAGTLDHMRDIGTWRDTPVYIGDRLTNPNIGCELLDLLLSGE